MKYIDTHCHLLFPFYDEDREEVLLKVDDELDLFIEIGGDLDNSQKVVDFIKKISLKLLELLEFIQPTVKALILTLLTNLKN